MSLRRDIHSAFEVITPPLGGMPERTVQTVLAEYNGQRRKKRMPYRVRAPLALVAALIAVAVCSLAVLTWNATRSVTPAAHVGQPSVQQLESRSVNLAVLATGAACPATPPSNQAWAVSLAGSHFSDNDGNQYWDVEALTSRDLKGPVLLRGRDLRTGHDMFFRGQWSYGPVVGTVAGADLPNGAKVANHSELLLDPSQPPHQSTALGLYRWSFVAGVAQGGPRWCLGLQVDATGGFTETVVLAF